MGILTVTVSINGLMGTLMLVSLRMVSNTGKVNGERELPKDKPIIVLRESIEMT
jgi:hypothetical protein